MGADGIFHCAAAPDLEEIPAESGISRDRHRGIGHRRDRDFSTDRSVKSFSGAKHGASLVDYCELKQIDVARSGKDKRGRARRLSLYETPAGALRRACRVRGPEDARLPKV